MECPEYNYVSNELSECSADTCTIAQKLLVDGTCETCASGYVVDSTLKDCKEVTCDIVAEIFNEQCGIEEYGECDFGTGYEISTFEYMTCVADLCDPIYYYGDDCSSQDTTGCDGGLASDTYVDIYGAC